MPCGAHRTDGAPCGAWSVRGAFVCSVHGGRAPQVRAWTEYRLWHDRFWLRAKRDLARALEELDERMRTDPEAVRAETVAWLRELDLRVRQFRREHGRRPGRRELARLLDWP